jgi:putative hydrolase of the HAD superfamily
LSRARASTVWLFDLDDTLHDATSASMSELRQAMGAYIVEHLKLTDSESDALRRRYWLRYGATLLGLVRHHGVKAAHFLQQTHQLPGLETRIRGHRADLAALKRLPGRKLVLTNAPAAYAARVLKVLGVGAVFDAVLSIEDMQMFGQLRPKPDARMLRRLAARLGVPPAHCVLVEDTLVHQKAARRVGMGTVWMQRWLPQRGAMLRKHRRPAYVDRRVRRLRDLR